MHKKKMTKSALAFLLTLLLIFVAACSGGGNSGSGGGGASTPAPNAGTAGSGSGSGSDSGSAQTQEPDKSKEPITLSVLFNSTDSTFEETEVYQEIIRQTGVTMDIEKYDEEKFKVMLAGGDLPDIIQVPDQYLKQLIEGNNIIPLDDLVETNGPDLKNPVYEPSLEFMRKNKSNGTGKLYLIPIQIGPSDYQFNQDVGFVTRWDYYKEIGAPPIKSIDDMVDVLARMVRNHPTTPEGKKVYGVSMWNDWGLWGLQSMGMITGYSTFSKAQLAAWDVIERDYFNQYTDPEHSSIWDTAYFLYKANQAGILDPDAFTDKYADVEAKAMQGTLLYAPADWPFQKVNAELLKEKPDAGFQTIPLDWGYSYAAGNRTGGWGGKAFAITSNAKNPERAMDLINFIASEEGSRLIGSGIKGVHWDMEDGEPQLKDETIKLMMEGGDPWIKTGIGGMTNQQGLGDFIVLSDGGVVKLANTAKAFKVQMNTLHEDFSKHYGVNYPGEIFKKYYDEGKVVNNNQRPSDELAAMEDLPEDLKFISSKLDDMVTKGIPQIVLNAKSDEEYVAMQQKLIEELRAEGADEVFDWVYKEYQRVLAEAGVSGF